MSARCCSSRSRAARASASRPRSRRAAAWLRARGHDVRRDPRARRHPARAGAAPARPRPGRARDPAGRGAALRRRPRPPRRHRDPAGARGRAGGAHRSLRRLDAGLPGRRARPARRPRPASITDWATAGLLPDLTVLLDLDPRSSAWQRAGARAALDRLEAASLEFHEAVRAGFLDLAARRARALPRARRRPRPPDELAAAGRGPRWPRASSRPLGVERCDSMAVCRTARRGRRDRRRVAARTPRPRRRAAAGDVAARPPGRGARRAPGRDLRPPRPAPARVRRAGRAAPRGRAVRADRRRAGRAHLRHVRAR